MPSLDDPMTRDRYLYFVGRNTSLSGAERKAGIAIAPLFYPGGVRSEHACQVRASWLVDRGVFRRRDDAGRALFGLHMQGVLTKVDIENDRHRDYDLMDDTTWSWRKGEHALVQEEWEILTRADSAWGNADRARLVPHVSKVTIHAQPHTTVQPFDREFIAWLDFAESLARRFGEGLVHALFDEVERDPDALGIVSRNQMFQHRYGLAMRWRRRTGRSWR